MKCLPNPFTGASADGPTGPTCNGAPTSPDKCRPADCLRPSPATATADGDDDDAQRPTSAGRPGTSAIPDALGRSKSDCATGEHGGSTFSASESDINHRGVVLLHHEHRCLGAWHGDVPLAGSSTCCVNRSNANPHTKATANSRGEAGAKQSDSCLRDPDGADSPAGSPRSAGSRRSTTSPWRSTTSTSPSSSPLRQCRLRPYHLSRACSLLSLLATWHHAGSPAGPAGSKQMARCSGLTRVSGILI